MPDGNVVESNMGDLAPMDISATAADGSEDMYFVVSDVPDGAVLAVGVDENGDIVQAGMNGGDGTWIVSADEIGDLMILPPEGVSGGEGFDMTVTAVTVEDDGAINFDSSVSFNVTLDDSYGEDGARTGASMEGGGESTTVVIADGDLPEGAMLSEGVYNPVSETWVMTGEEADALEILAPDDYDGGDLEVPMTTVTTSDSGEVSSDEVSFDVDADELGVAENDADVTMIDGGTGDDDLTGTGGDDWMMGGSGDDQLEGGAGDDIFEGGAGDDFMVGDAGNDLFIFGMNEGSDFISGGAGYTDVIRMDGMTEDPVMGLDDVGNWTITTEDGYSYVPGEGADDMDSIVFDEGDAAGTITLEDGTEIDFDGIDKIMW
ncbi:hypothetical protein MAIT1_02886 [Magnetofaba australis IT-1]|uniref:Uncharacterized protein n=2 Tax=Magnetofaba TaxID=1472292 RepID=A0A1Y2K5G1_9PROT|nr:hypothetical protein MAIT1_02886 [Magnetofaba australis IT-1]